MRNLGSAFGVSLTTSILGSSFQTIHSQLTRFANPFNRALGVNSESMYMNPLITFGRSGLNGLIRPNSPTLQLPLTTA